MSNCVWLPCRHTSGSELGKPERGHFYALGTKFQLRRGVEYPALGIGIWETTLVVLVRDETRLPNWLPTGLFEIELDGLPSSWEFRVYDGRAASGGDALNRWVAIWSYRRLVRDETHRDGLIERDPEALRLFAAELDSQ